MAANITNYKCPACTGPLHFAGDSGKVECDYCGSSFTTDEIEDLYKGQNDAAVEADAALSVNEKEWVDDSLKAYSCPSCGAELICDETTAATSCPYCGNPTVVPGQFTGTLRPEYIIPFKLEKETAKKKLSEHYQGKFLLPKTFSNDNHINEIQGVYVPFWLYDGKAEGSISYHGVKIQRKSTSTKEIEIRDHFSSKRSGEISFIRIPADASKKMDDDMMDSIEPFDYNALTEFSESYLPGYLADKYDVSAEENSERAMSRAKGTILEKFKEDAMRQGYSELDTTAENIRVSEAKASYAMMPVWMLTTKWENQLFTFMMNGQTGKMVGNLPVDKTKATITGIITFIITAIISFAIGGFINEEPLGAVGLLIFAVIVPAIITGLVISGLIGQLKSVAKAVEANQYISPEGIKISHREDVFIRREERVTKKETDK